MSFLAGIIDALSHTPLTSHNHTTLHSVSSSARHQRRLSRDMAVKSRDPYKRRQECRDTLVPCATTGFMPQSWLQGYRDSAQLARLPETGPSAVKAAG